MTRSRTKSGSAEKKRAKRVSQSGNSPTTTLTKSNGQLRHVLSDLDIQRNEQKIREKEERENVVLFKHPILTLYYAARELAAKLGEVLISFYNHKIVVLLSIVTSAFAYYGYTTPGNHQQHVQSIERVLLWYLWWVGLGVLSSVGLGTGLHTFLIYLGPHIAKVTLAAYECNSLDFPEPPYPTEVTCPTDGSRSSLPITLWSIVSKVRWEALFWGAGTALGELPPYFMARAARLSGHEEDDEELAEYVAFKAQSKKNPKKLSLLDKSKLWTEALVTRVGFFGILIFASIPNPLFDLAGIICGHSLIPFWTFFGATLVGKAMIKMHVQMLFVIITFSEHHVDDLVSLMKKVPKYGPFLQAPFKEFLQEQKRKLHRNPGDPVEEQHVSLIQHFITALVSLMVLTFLVSIVNSLAQSYHKRVADARRQRVKAD